MTSCRQVRMGIDVGGTFTHAVAIDNHSLEVLAHQVTPTTHTAAEGVAKGIMTSLKMLLNSLAPDTQVVFLAHSTTQATNALLEGDVAKVGIVGLGHGIEAVKARSDLTIGDLELSPGKWLSTNLEFVDLNPSSSLAALTRLKEANCQAIVAAQGFSVDDPTGELRVIDQAQTTSLPSCGTHQMSGLYGLRVRARTAVINASILPKMIETAELTQQALTASDLHAPMMVMRSDGGVMSLDEVRRRPVMTLLSGPAAGVAAALMFLKASDALFLEVGGTSTDICLVKDGKASVRSAVVGGHPTYLKTLDSRTLGIAGGSMIGRTEKGLDVGPRSAHVAGFTYCSFAQPFQGELKVVEIHPQPGDPGYLVLEDSTGQRSAPTTTCAANVLGQIQPGSYSAGNLSNATQAFTALAQYLGIDTGESLARIVLETAAAKVVPTIKALLKEGGARDRAVKLLGGGGGAGAIVPMVAQILGMPYELAEKAEVISAIGAALAMVKEVAERHIVNPSQNDIAQLRSEVKAKVITMGADPQTIEVSVSVDAQKSLVTAVAIGSIAFSDGSVSLTHEVSPEARIATLHEAAPTSADFTPMGDTGHFYLFRGQQEERYLFNLLKRTKTTIWVTDRLGNVKLQVPRGLLEHSQSGQLETSLSQTIAKYTTYGDAGALIPAIHIVAGHRLTDLTSLTTAEQALMLARQELLDLPPENPIFFIIHPPSS